MRTKLDGGIGAKQFAHEKLKRALQICDADVFIDIETFDLVKLRAVSRVDFLTAIGSAGRDHTNGRRRRLHCSNLHSRSVSSKQTAVRQIKSVLLGACRVFRRRVERVETMPFVFNVGSVRQREAHSPENLDRPLEHSRKRMKRADLVRCSGK